MKIRRRLVLALVTGGVLAAILSVQPARQVRAQSTGPVTVRHSFALLDLTRGFSARATVFNASGVGGLPPGPCDVEIRFVGDPNIIGDPNTRGTLLPGQRLDFHLNGNSVIPGSAPFGTQDGIGAGIVLIGDPNILPGCVSSFRIFNNDSGIDTAVQGPQPHL